MKVLVIGSGGREHALCWKLRKNRSVEALYCAPGNPGIAAIAEIVPIKGEQVEELVRFAISREITFTVVGPELPLTLGVVDAFRAAGLTIFGPTRAAAQLEGSKSFAKEIMLAAGVPTAEHRVFTDEPSARAYLSAREGPIVLKADGLAAGKGVFVCKDRDESLTAVKELFASFKAARVVAEQFLEGVEVSFIVATDGEQVVPLASSHDYKRIGDGDSGPNTGGMGSVCPSPRLSTYQEERLVDAVIRPVLREMQRRGSPFSGFLYAGLMIDRIGKPWVLEFNTRLGDPETQSIMRRVGDEFVEVLAALAERRKLPALSWSSNAAVCVVIAAGGYPGTPQSGDEIAGLDLAGSLPGVVVFHAGTAIDPKKRALCTSGGRVLGVTAVGPDVESARAAAYRACDMIQFRGCQLRRDIGA